MRYVFAKDGISKLNVQMQCLTAHWQVTFKQQETQIYTCTSKMLLDDDYLEKFTSEIFKTYVLVCQATCLTPVLCTRDSLSC